MKTRISPTVIGLFVIGSLAVLVVAVVGLGSGRWFRKPYEFVLYFQGSVNGLNVGAPVKYKGVEIGSVTDILLQLDQVEVDRIPVIIELDAQKIAGRRVERDFERSQSRDRGYYPGEVQAGRSMTPRPSTGTV